MNKFINIYGIHAAIHALLNKSRVIKKVYLTENAKRKIDISTEIDLSKFDFEINNTKQLNSLLPSGSIHQGIIVKANQKETLSLNEIEYSAIKTIVILDQILDPRNFGAILRVCAAFRTGHIIITKQFANFDEGLIAKAASGGIEYVNIIEVKNLSNAIEKIKKNGFWVCGLDGNASQTIGDINSNEKNALVFGEEGKGMRLLTKKKCDNLYSINTTGEIESLNVSMAAGIVLQVISNRI